MITIMEDHSTLTQTEHVAKPVQLLTSHLKREFYHGRTNHKDSCHKSFFNTMCDSKAPFVVQGVLKMMITTR